MQYPVILDHQPLRIIIISEDYSVEEIIDLVVVSVFRSRLVVSRNVCVHLIKPKLLKDAFSSSTLNTYGQSEIWEAFEDICLESKCNIKIYYLCRA